MINDNDEGYVSHIKVIAGAAITEHVIDMNGNASKHIAKSRYTLLNGIASDGKGNEVEVSEGACVSPYAYKYPLNLDETPVDWDQILNLDPKVRMTKGLYMIKYTPKGSRDYRKGRPFKIGQDLIRWDIRISGPREWHELCERVPELKWIDRNSTLQDRMFSLAARHPGMTFWFSVDWIRYEDLLNAKAQTILKKPFLSRKCSVEEYKNVYKAKDKTIMIRYFNDILKEINEVEALDTVQEEMKQYTGEEYGRSRKLSRDPITGQFINKKQEEE